MIMQRFYFRDFVSLGLKRPMPDMLDIPDGARILNLGAGNQELQWRHETLDLPEWDGNCDQIPFGTGELDVVFAFHFLEHLTADGVIHTLREVERVLKPGGVFNIVVPHGSSKLAYEDIGHITRFNEDTWRNLFRTTYYAQHGEWLFDVKFNVLFGLKLDNLCLFTQLYRRAE